LILLHLGFAIPRQSYLAKASARGRRRTALLPPSGADGPSWETLF